MIGEIFDLKGNYHVMEERTASNAENILSIDDRVGENEVVISAIDRKVSANIGQIENLGG